MQAMSGFTYIGLLFAIAILGFAMAAVGTMWSTAAKRDREQQLLWTGAQFRRAIASYYTNGPPGVREFPRDLADLLEDRRGPVIRRHLRRLYVDPRDGELSTGRSCGCPMRRSSASPAVRRRSL